MDRRSSDPLYLADWGLADWGLADGGLLDCGLADCGLADCGLAYRGLPDCGLAYRGLAYGGLADWDRGVACPRNITGTQDVSAKGPDGRLSSRGASASLATSAIASVRGR